MADSPYVTDLGSQFEEQIAQQNAFDRSIATSEALQDQADLGNFIEDTPGEISAPGFDAQEGKDALFDALREKIPLETPDELRSFMNEVHQDNIEQHNPDSMLSKIKVRDGSFKAKDGRPSFVVNDLHFNFDTITGLDFNKNYGYDFYVIDTSKKGKAIYAQYKFGINPQSVQISVPTAVTVETTMRGILETHNSAPLRQISISGTTGVMPSGGVIAGSEKGELQKTLDYAFKNTIKAFDSTVNQAQKTLEAFQNNDALKNSGPLNLTNSDLSNMLNKRSVSRLYSMTGYQQVHDLMRFFDMYLALKKTAQGKPYRLVIGMHKDQMYYYCTLNNYSITKPPGSIEYNYSINLTSWSRKTAQQLFLDRATPYNLLLNRENSLSMLNRIVNGIGEARRTVALAHNVLAGIRSDINESLITPLGEVMLLLKDTLGLAQNMYDFAFTGELMRSLEESFKVAYEENREDLEQAIKPEMLKLGLIGAIGGVGGAVLSAIETSVITKSASGLASSVKSSIETADPLKVLFDAPAKFPQIFESVDMERLKLTNAITDQIDATVAKTQLFTPADIINRRNAISDFSRSISEAFGGGSATYNSINGLQTVKPTYKKMSVDDINLLSSLNDIVMGLDALTVEMQNAERDSGEDYFSFYGDYAVSAGLTFDQSSVSKFLVPFPYEATLEQLAGMYLGDPDRWIEIAALNGLKAPYVDEIGRDVAITASSGGNTLTVPSSEDFYVGQVVAISSDAQKEIKRKIKSIDVISNVEVILTFEASPGISLSSYKPNDNALITVTKPNTVNSNMLIAIPSPKASDIKGTFKIASGRGDLSKMAELAEVDFMLDKQGDIILKGKGDVQLAFGMTNLIQAAMLKLKTKLKTMLQHPKYGNPVQEGRSVADIDIRILTKLYDDLFSDDKRFSGVISSKIQIVGNAVDISLIVGIAGSNTTLPLSVRIPV